MSLAADNPTASQPVSVAKHNATQKNIRGSALLLAGRFLSLAANFAIQILTVRALSKSDYGAFAYALTVVSFGSNLAVFGLDKTVSRFLPIYQEENDYNRMFGTIIMSLATIIALGAALVLVVLGQQSLLNDKFINDANVVALIVAIIALAPLQALDSLYGSMLAVFAGPRSIFFRRYLLNPGLKLAVILVVIFVQGDVMMMAGGYLIAGVAAVIVYSAMLWHVFRSQGLFQFFSWRGAKMPIRAVFGFSLPLLSTDVVFLLRNFMVIAILQYYYAASDVAAYRAVLPVAGLNMFVYESFTFLFMPTASRMFARKEWANINDLYWQTASWIAIASFPVFVLTFALAQPLTLLLFGERYSQSGVILMILALGYFVNAALGFNSFTLRVYGKVRSIVVIDIVAAAISVGACFLLVPRFGVVGAAVAVTATLIIHNVLNQTGLAMTTNIHLFEWRYAKVYLGIAAASVALLLLQTVLAPPDYVSVTIAAAVSLLLLYLNRENLMIAQMFPELLRLPLLRNLLVPPKAQAVPEK